MSDLNFMRNEGEFEEHLTLEICKMQDILENINKKMLLEKKL